MLILVGWAEGATEDGHVFGDRESHEFVVNRGIWFRDPMREIGSQDVVTAPVLEMSMGDQRDVQFAL